MDNMEMIEVILLIMKPYPNNTVIFQSSLRPIRTIEKKLIVDGVLSTQEITVTPKRVIQKALQLIVIFHAMQSTLALDVVGPVV